MNIKDLDRCRILWLRASDAQGVLEACTRHREAGWTSVLYETCERGRWHTHLPGRGKKGGIEMTMNQPESKPLTKDQVFRAVHRFAREYGGPGPTRIFLNYHDAQYLPNVTYTPSSREKTFMGLAITCSSEVPRGEVWVGLVQITGKNRSRPPGRGGEMKAITMVDMRWINAATPDPFYGCADEGCADERSWPSEEIYWWDGYEYYDDDDDRLVRRDGPPTPGWYCEGCIDDQNGTPGKGPSLKERTGAMRVSDISAWATCEAMALSNPPRETRVGVAAWVGTMAHAKLAGLAGGHLSDPPMPARVRMDSITTTAHSAAVQAQAIADEAYRILGREGWAILESEQPLSRDGVTGHLDIKAWHGDTKREAIIDLKTGHDVGTGWLQVGGYIEASGTEELGYGGILHVPRVRLGEPSVGSLEIRDGADLWYAWRVAKQRIDAVVAGAPAMRSPGQHCGRCVALCPVRA